jgi:molybdopterin-guanine dinucleotide biosynthesis protein B
MTELIVEENGRRIVPVIGFVGFSDSGKTTLAVEVVRRLELAGLKVAVVKHDGHGHYKEVKETDSAAYRSAGASSVVVLSPDSLVIFERKASPTLEKLLERLSAHEDHYDVIITEGFKGSGLPKIAVARSEEDLTVLEQLGPGLLAIACRQGLSPSGYNLPILDIADPAAVVQFILQYLDSL